MIKVLINDEWNFIPAENLQLGSDTFSFETGLYETFRTIDFKPLFLKPHLDRLFHSMEKLNLSLDYSQLDIVKMINKVINNFPDPNQRARILVVPNKLIVYTSHLNLDTSIYKGVSAITVKSFRENPELKTTNYHACLNAWEIAQEKNCFEALLMDEDGMLFEGSRSNFFWIINGNLYTRMGDVLPGVTRQTIINRSSFQIENGLLNISEINKLDECFLSNSGSGIIPVIKLNDDWIGDGTVGPITKQLLSSYQEWMIHDDQGDSFWLK